MATDALIIIPTYKEADNIRNIITAIFGLPKQFDILVVDDNSPDETAAIVRELQTSYPNQLFLMERPGKMGLGTAYIAGFKWALQHQYQFVFEMDADFSHNPNDLIPLYEACRDNQAGMSIGSRYKKGVAIVNWPLGRLLMSYFASLYVRLITRMDIRDATAGFVCLSRTLLEKLDLDKIRMKGYGFQIEMKFKTWKLGFPIVEVPVIFINREIGTSKMSGGIFSEAFMGVIRMKISSLRRNYAKHISNRP
ncbi:MAG: polyprenol monophosphomannose synthase [Bacteroidales bacterium]|jgi:dolichol-phosphate mannosyltransferase|nr:polyprenol monophosphomannose synthase [Bacteroidales bacterium]MDD2569548.1 polyprenol monophosphomannose synthase [Bacteroidales bacterium]MDD2812827.1 polyprenol monophosphomannose synthase [Bacteroidales bacterium]MDD3385652.1 polyprenol monophosphomannose synthase [Bacteroidales bacterium]MDD3811212.1 polyprenol monophosphomannose synthase [Bacteroidales bacterium]